MPDRIQELEDEFDRQVAELAPYDAAAWLGYPAASRTAYPDPAAFRAALAAHGIPRALVSHTMGELHDAAQGNAVLAESLTALPGLSGVMTLLPEGADEFDHLEEAIEDNLCRGLRAARLYPRSHRYSLSLPTVPRLLGALESRGIPLFIPIGQTSWDEIGGLGRRHPRLAILVEGPGHHEYLNLRGALAWLEAMPNLLVPTNRQFLCGGLELLVERLGSHRVFFTTDQPIDDPAASLALLAFSELPLETRRQIAHGNLEKLLAGVGQGGYFA